ncbi:MAG TPA: hypothetical protein VIQ31_31025, partial [Phormidium sp.]
FSKIPVNLSHICGMWAGTSKRAIDKQAGQFAEGRQLLNREQIFLLPCPRLACSLQKAII